MGWGGSVGMSLPHESLESNLHSFHCHSRLTAPQHPYVPDQHQALESLPRFSRHYGQSVSGQKFICPEF